MSSPNKTSLPTSEWQMRPRKIEMRKNGTSNGKTMCDIKK
jgi:hypothetical protein